MSSHIEQLKELTAHLVPGLDAMITADSPCRVYLTIKGRLVGVHIYSDHSIAICRLMATADTELGFHQHANEHETLGVIQGHCIHTLKYSDGRVEVRELKLGETLYIPPGVIHNCVYPELTLQWAVTTPPAPGFPLPGRL